MRRIVDFSDYQAGVDLDVAAQAVDGFWCKAADWSWTSAYGWPGDDLHVPAIRRLQALGKPVGSYLFVRPGWTAPATQIDAWRENTPDGTTVAPMVDLEVPGTLSGAALEDWVNGALLRTADRFETIPVLYWSDQFARSHGMTAPDAPHIPMVAEYHRGYQPAYWANQTGWETWAYGAYGGPDVPPGYPGFLPVDLVWQWTSSAQVPGFVGLVDCSFATEVRWSELTTLGVGSVPTPPPAPTPSEDDMLHQVLNIDTGTVYARDGFHLVPIPSPTALSNMIAWGLLDDGPPLRLADWQIRDSFVTVPPRLNGEHLDLPASFAQLNQTVTAGFAATVEAAGRAVDVERLAARIVDTLTARGGSWPNAATVAAAVRAELAAALTGAAGPAGDPADMPVPPVSSTVRAEQAIAALADDLFDPSHGLAARVELETAKLRPAPGEPVTDNDRQEALIRALADTAARAGLKARNADI